MRLACLVGGFDLKAGDRPIVPVMPDPEAAVGLCCAGASSGSLWVCNEKLAQDVACDLFFERIQVAGFFLPVAPKGQARIRTQLSAAYEKRRLDTAIAAFKKVGAKHGILGLWKQQIIDRFGM